MFFGGRLVGFSGSVIHISDIGGRFGAHDATEVFEEGLCFPVVRLYDEGRLNADILAILRANVRVPELAEGDVRAQVAANEVGARLLVEFLEEYALPDLEGLSATLQGRVEEAMRARIAELPDGSFDYETYAETGIATEDILIRSTITISGDEIVVDYAGSSPQTQEAGVNCVLNCTRSLTLFPLHAALLPEIPSNEGMTRPIHVVAPLGQHHERPTPCAGRRACDGHAPSSRSRHGLTRVGHRRPHHRRKRHPMDAARRPSAGRRLVADDLELLPGRGDGGKRTA